nr:MAG TPA: ATP-dependent DNA helicase [Caudoviricetes sp.]
MENNIEIKFEKIEVTEENMKKLLNKIGQLKWELDGVKYWENYYKNRVKFWLNENDKEIEKNQKLTNFNIALIIALFLESAILVLLALNFK